MGVELDKAIRIVLYMQIIYMIKVKILDAIVKKLMSFQLFKTRRNKR